VKKRLIAGVWRQEFSRLVAIKGKADAPRLLRMRRTRCSRTASRHRVITQMTPMTGAKTIQYQCFRETRVRNTNIARISTRRYGLSEQRAQRAAGSGQRDFRLSALAPRGRIPSAQRRCGNRRPEGRTGTVRTGDGGIHHRAHRGANLLQVESNLTVALANVSLGLTAIYRPDPALRRQAQQLGNANP
jgi:hypothetical protein